MNSSQQRILIVVCGFILIAFIVAKLYDTFGSTVTTTSKQEYIKRDSIEKVVAKKDSENRTVTMSTIRKIPIFRDVGYLQSKLGSVGIGEMRKWWTDGNGWLSASNFYEFGDSGPVMPSNLAFYLESPIEDDVQTLKLKLNINNMAEKQQALKLYTKTAKKTFKVIGLTMPDGLEDALLKGQEFEKETDQYLIRNIYEPGNIDSWKLAIVSH